MISEYTIQQVKEKAICADVINDFVPLKKQGANMVCACMFHTEKSASFTVNTKDNFYKCFGCGASGDSIEFLIKYKKWTYQESIEYLASKYKILMEKDTPSKTYSKPVWKNKTELSDKLVKWIETERHIKQETLVKMKITEGLEYMPQASAEINTIQFNYFRDNELINVKYRDGKKRMKLHKDGELIFYNLDSIKNAKEVYITEGEFDVLALVQSGIMREGVGIISVPNGANIKTNNLTYLDSSIDLFDSIEKIHLATDNDIPGRKLREDLAERFGKDKCDYIEFKDCKDANDVLVKYGIQGVIECCAEKKEFPLEGVYTISTFSDEIDDMFINGMDRGAELKMGKIDGLLRFVKGYITVITGIPNHGKSDWLDQIILKLNVEHGWKCAYYSPENKPTKLHFSKLARKLIGKNWFGKDKMNEVEKDACKSYLEGKIWFIRPEKDFTLDSILTSVKMLKKRKGIDCFVLDAWNRLEHKFGGSTNETKYINESLIKLDAFCELHNVHCFLVAHPTKIEKDKKTGNYFVPTLYNISGSSHFYNIVANGMTVYRDFANNTTEVHIQKVKFSHWGSVGMAEYKYDLECGRYNETVAGNSIPDKNNWITQGRTQSTLNLEEESPKVEVKINHNDIIGDDGVEPPF